VATYPDHHPLDREIEAIYAANPGLREELDEMEDQLDRGELELVEDEHIRRRAILLAKRLGERLAGEES
jgi:hypothetical protein